MTLHYNITCYDEHAVCCMKQNQIFTNLHAMQKDLQWRKTTNYVALMTAERALKASNLIRSSDISFNLISKSNISFAFLYECPNPIHIKLIQDSDGLLIFI